MLSGITHLTESWFFYVIYIIHKYVVSGEREWERKKQTRSSAVVKIIMYVTVHGPAQFKIKNIYTEKKKKKSFWMQPFVLFRKSWWWLRWDEIKKIEQYKFSVYSVLGAKKKVYSIKSSYNCIFILHLMIMTMTKPLPSSPLFINELGIFFCSGGKFKNEKWVFSLPPGGRARERKKK